MLLELSVQDFGIIDSIRWQPAAGLSVLTGETGAGKSLIIDAIGALLGGRAGEELIRSGAETARIEGVFSARPGSQVERVLQEWGCTDEDSLILVREIGRKSRNFCRVNGRTVPLRALREISRALIDIHGQSDQVSLRDREQQLLLLDRYSGAEDLRSCVEQKVTDLRSVQNRLRTLDTDERERSRRIDLLGHQTAEIRSADLHAGEQEELEQESALLSNVQKLKSLSEEAHGALHGSELSQGAAIDQIGQAVRCLRELVEVDGSLSKLLRDTETALYQIEDACHTLRSYHTTLEADPARLEYIEQRLDLIRNLKRKYGNTVEEVLAYAEEAERELSELGKHGEDRDRLEQKAADLKQGLTMVADQLSRQRHAMAVQLATEVEAELAELSMPQVRFQIQLDRLDEGDTIRLPDGRSCPVGRNGIDRVEFLVSTNPGEPFKPLAKIASTGETSRLLLAIKAALSKADATPILIFDEIDIGVGGRSGEVIGKKLVGLSKSHQVISITHLPQVAMYADGHYVVSKAVEGGRAQITVTAVSGQSRVEEISAMLGSQSEPTWESAQEFARRAEAWKQGLQ